MRFRPALILTLAAPLLVGAPPAMPRAKGPAQLKVAHFLTEDGTLGFVLDRSQEPAKLRFDKERAILELTLEEDLRAGQRRGITYRRPDGRSVLYIDVAGSIQVFTAQGSLPVRSDRVAAPLPRATVTGQYRRPKTFRELALEQLAPLTVMARFPGFRPEDSGNLEEVAKAFERIDASMLVRINGTGSHDAQWAPASSRIGDTEQGLGGGLSLWTLEEVPWDPKAPGLA